MSQHPEVLRFLRPVLGSMTEAALAACEGALARVWLAGPGDLCPACPMRRECPSQTTCLHLVASAGVTSRLDGPFRRFPIGARLVGRIPVTHEAVFARADLPGLGVAEPAWLDLHGVRSFAALPLDHAERCIGVLAVFSRGDLPEEQVRLLWAAAHLGAAAVGSTEAYRAAAAERNRLAARNAGLRPGRGEDRQAATSSRAAAGLVAEPGTRPASDPRGPQPTLAQIQREGILRTLERTGWRVSGPRGAAVALGLKPTTLESKMKRLGIRRPPR
jgi:transcriptional regulator with GAF, ATPase, and Fis domain